MPGLTPPELLQQAGTMNHIRLRALMVMAISAELVLILVLLLR